MKNYVRKPFLVQAFKWDGSLQSLIDNLPENHQHDFWYFGYTSGNGPDPKIHIDDLSSQSDELARVNYISNVMDYVCINDLKRGGTKAYKGDYIVCGVFGEYYSYKPDVFKAMYEEVD